MGVNERAGLVRQVALQGEALNQLGDAWKRTRDEVTRLHEMRKGANARVDAVMIELGKLDDRLVELAEAQVAILLRLSLLERFSRNHGRVIVGLILAWAFTMIGMAYATWPR